MSSIRVDSPTNKWEPDKWGQNYKRGPLWPMWTTLQARTPMTHVDYTTSEDPYDPCGLHYKWGPLWPMWTTLQARTPMTHVDYTTSNDYQWSTFSTLNNDMQMIFSFVHTWYSRRVLLSGQCDQKSARYRPFVNWCPTSRLVWLVQLRHWLQAGGRGCYTGLVFFFFLLLLYWLQ